MQAVTGWQANVHSWEMVEGRTEVQQQNFSLTDLCNIVFSAFRKVQPELHHKSTIHVWCGLHNKGHRQMIQHLDEAYTSPILRLLLTIQDISKITNFDVNILKKSLLTTLSWISNSSPLDNVPLAVLIHHYIWVACPLCPLLSTKIPSYSEQQ